MVGMVRLTMSLAPSLELEWLNAGLALPFKKRSLCPIFLLVSLRPPHGGGYGREFFQGVVGGEGGMGGGGWQR